VHRTGKLCQTFPLNVLFWLSAIGYYGGNENQWFKLGTSAGWTGKQQVGIGNVVEHVSP